MVPDYQADQFDLFVPMVQPVQDFQVIRLLLEALYFLMIQDHPVDHYLHFDLVLLSALVVRLGQHLQWLQAGLDSLVSQCCLEVPYLQLAQYFLDYLLVQLVQDYQQVQIDQADQQVQMALLVLVALETLVVLGFQLDQESLLVLEAHFVLADLLVLGYLYFQ